MGNIRPPPIVIAVVVMEVQTVNSASCKATAATRRGVQPSPPRSNLSVWSVCFLALLDHVRSSNGQSGGSRLGHVWLVGPGSQAGRRGRREGPPWMCPPLPRQVCSGGPYRQTDSSGFSLSMDGGGVTGPGIDVVVVVSTHPREEDQENERKKKDGTCRRPKETPK